MTTFKMLFTVTTLAGLTFAQNDPPARAGRLNYLNGQVSFQAAGADNWEAAQLNAESGMNKTSSSVIQEETICPALI